MSTSGLSINSAAGAPLSVSGLASGLDTSAIISALMGVEREPVTHLGAEQQKLQAQQSALGQIRSSLQQLATSASEFGLPSLFESSQSVTSSEPLRVAATTTDGAGVGGYEVEVKQLANSAQRSFTFTSPAAADTITIDGQTFTIKAGGSAKELASEINSNSSATVYAAALEDGTLVLSSRATGSTGAEFIKVSDPGNALAEVAGTAKEGKNAEFSVDGVAGSASSNTVTSAIPGVTLTLEGLTTSGPVTIDVQAPGPSASHVEAQVQSFVKLYNSTVEAIEHEIATKPPVKGLKSGEFTTGTLFGDEELEGLLSTMRQAIYEPAVGLEAEMASPADVGISTGASTGGAAPSQSSIEGLLTLDPTKLAAALQSNPAGVEKMLGHFSEAFQSTVNSFGGPGGTLEGRLNGDAGQIAQLTSQINNMNEMLLVREKALQATYAQLEAVMSQNNAQSAYLTRQLESLGSSTKG